MPRLAPRLTMPISSYALLLQSATVVLDSFPYSGFTTAVEVLAMGLPVVTLPSPTFRGSQTASLIRVLDETVLRCAGRSEEACAFVRQPKLSRFSLSDALIAHNASHWVMLSSELAESRELRQEVCEILEQRVPVLFEQGKGSPGARAAEGWVQFLKRSVKSVRFASLTD
jgi:hypothetical protein